jgi:hypothetical protein
MSPEGIVSKRLSKPYQSGRSGHWLKVKNPDNPASQTTATSGQSAAWAAPELGGSPAQRWFVCFRQLRTWAKLWQRRDGPKAA